MSYANLHTHSDYSNTRLIDSINKIPNMFTTAKELGLSALALTDHEFLGGHLKALEFVSNKQKEDETWKNFKVILGNEIYLCRNGLNKDTVEKGEKYPHFILLALDTIGHEQLREISSRAWSRSYMMFLKRVPTWYKDIEDIVLPNQGHIIATSACIGNQLGIWFLNNEFDKIEEHLLWCQKTFGKDNFYLEMSPAAYEEQVLYNKFLIELHNKYNIPLTIATDAHYGRPKDYKIHEAFLKSKEEDRETADFYKYTYLMTVEEIYELMNYIDKSIIDEALSNTIKISDRVIGYDLYHGQIIPRLPDNRISDNFDFLLENSKIKEEYVYINKYIKSEYEDDRYGAFLLLTALKEMNLSGDRLLKHLKQIELELEEMWVVSEKIGQRLMSYFLTIRVVIQKIWNEVDSITGAGRGSGPASLVCFLLGICDGDPLEQGFELWFYRFIHRERAELPDWDFDSEASKRPAISQMVYNMCKNIGGDAISVCTFGTEGSRSALLTACRGMGLSNDVGQYLSSLIGQNRGFNYSLEDVYNGNEDKGIPQSKDFKNEIDKYPDLYDTACAISGLITRLGQHACMSEGSQVLTLEGYKNIENITTDDYVYTHKGRYRRVLNTMINPGKEIFEISSSYMLDNIRATGDHPIFIRQQDGSYVWKEVEKLEATDLMAIPINQNSILPSYKNLDFSFDMFWLLGRYLGDGWTETIHREGKTKDWIESRVVICCDKTNDEELKEITLHIENAGYTYYIIETRTSYKIYINSNNELYEYLNRFKHGAENKIVHSDILNSPKEYIREFLKGYFSADGYLDKKRNIQECKSISKNLIRGISECVNKAYNNYGTFVHYNAKEYTIENRPVKCKDNWKFCYSINRTQKKLLIENNFIWIPIKEIRNIGKADKTYNLEVDEDNSFTVNNVAVHNCGMLLYNGNVYDHNALATTPSGARVSQFDLSDSEKMGSIKYDFLSTDALDKIHTCMNLLIKDGLMEWQGSLRKTYNKYIHPDVLDRTSKDMWEMLNQGKIISAFQMDSIVAKQTLASIHPTSLLELAAVNSLMRLVPEKGHKSPAEEYLDYKLHPEKLRSEVYSLDGTDKEKDILYKYLKQYNGVLESQENMMRITMIPEFTNFSFSNASKLRKIVAKKKLKEVDSFKEFFIKTGIENGCSEGILRYIWDVQIKRQLGYSFNLTHCTYYSLIGLQEMNLAYHYPQIYWATSCLIVDSGSFEQDEEIVSLYEKDTEEYTHEDLDDKSNKINKATNYAKVAAAIGRIVTEGYEVKLPLINKASLAFVPNAEDNSIIYGLKGISEINDDLVRIIIMNRPYKSLLDFVEKCQPQKKQMINLIKAGSFTEFEDRRTSMNNYLASITPKKTRITLQNMNSLITYQLIPKDLISYVYLYNFNKYIKQSETPNGFKLDERSLDFISRNFPDIECQSGFMDTKFWKKFYENQMSGLKTWLKDNEQTLIDKINNNEIQEVWNKYCPGTDSSWEMDVLGFYYSGHELLNAKIDNLVSINDLKDGDYKHTVQIAGTVLGKEAYKHMITVLTPDGVVNLKFNGEMFANYNKTISQVKDGEKKVLEKSWFIKGTLLIIKGFKNGEVFRVKELSRIIEIDDFGNVKTTKYRYGGE